jgi:hypothetical protein
VAATGKPILVVEDNEGAREGRAAVLRRPGYAVNHADRLNSAHGTKTVAHAPPGLGGRTCRPRAHLPSCFPAACHTRSTLYPRACSSRGRPFSPTRCPAPTTTKYGVPFCSR